jgi:hypothetical protein
VFFVSSVKRSARLSDVAAQVFRALGVSEWEERHSANNPPDEHYFAVYGQNTEVTVCDRDDDRVPDYPFLVALEETSWRRGAGVLSAALWQCMKPRDRACYHCRRCGFQQLVK